jgi:lipoate-protein ligase A
MAADETLVRYAARGPALRFYEWTAATVSLGYFQPYRERNRDAALAALPWVRRPTGGGALVHHHELTYALAVPAASTGAEPSAWMRRMHLVLAEALGKLGVGLTMAVGAEVEEKVPAFLCFQQLTPGDLLCRGTKVVGSAQRRFREGLLQHGAILLERSEHAPALPGLRDLVGPALESAEIVEQVTQQFAALTGWIMEAGDWSEEEGTRIVELKADKYTQAAWNERR